MKRGSHLFALLFLMAFVTFTSCKDETADDSDDYDCPCPPPREFHGTYTVTNVTREDGIEVDLDEESVTLTFTEDGIYATIGAELMPGDDPPFPASGAWEFPEENVHNQILISGSDIDFHAVSITDSALSFTYTTQDAKSAGEDFTVTVLAYK